MNLLVLFSHEFWEVVESKTGFVETLWEVFDTSVLFTVLQRYNELRTHLEKLLLFGVVSHLLQPLHLEELL